MNALAPRPHAAHEVLVVDPDDDVRACLVLYLMLHGVYAIGARDEHDTLRRLRAGVRPCVVFVDPRRVGLEAWGLVDYLRADSVLTTVPLVLVAGEPLLLRSAHWRGVRECVAKPATPAHFVAALERQCRRPWMHHIADPRGASSIIRPAAVDGRRRRAGAAPLRRRA
jgi:DNA-binding NtrC family response regulator